MYKPIAIAALALSLLPMAATTAFAHAGRKHVMAHKMTATTMYQCAKCHMRVSAATAKKDHYKDSMDGGKLVPVK